MIIKLSLYIVFFSHSHIDRDTNCLTTNVSALLEKCIEHKTMGGVMVWSHEVVATVYISVA